MPERSAQEWMRFAWPHLGAHEAPGSRINPVIAAMYRDSGHGGIKDDAVPWCAAFVGAVLARAGMTSTGSLRARSYLDWGVAVDDPITGAVAVLSRGKNPALGHVGFVVGATATELFLLGGNQSNRVSVGRFARSRLLGLRLPEGASAPARDVAGDDRFDDCLAHVLDMEGGYSNDPHDPGGPTNKGITLATYARFRRTPLTRSNRDALISDLQVISNDDVKDIYRRRYWNVSRAAEMGAGVDLIHFDATVNHGATGAAKLVQATVGVAVDGEIGPITMAAIQRQATASLIPAYAQARRARYRALPHFWRFGRGWLRRVDRTERAALQAVQSSSAESKGNREMTDVTQPKVGETETQSKWWVQSMTLWGAFITTMSTVVPVIAPVFGLTITPDVIEQFGQQVLTILQALGGISGIMLTIFGRLRATTKLSGKSS